jgi:murein endopeptidase
MRAMHGQMRVFSPSATASSRSSAPPARARRLVAPRALCCAAWIAIAAVAPALTPAEGSARCFSRSIGHPEHGTLRGGAALAAAGRYHLVQQFTRDHGLIWGTCRLVRGLQAFAKRAYELHGRRVVIGNLSAEGGGDMPHSRSHESGRDVDIAFQMMDGDGKPTYAYYHRFDERLFSRSHGGRYRFDVAANWALVRALLETEEFVIERIVVAPYLRAALLGHASAHVGAELPAALLRRAREALVPPWPGVKLHDNHFHVRIACDPAHEPWCREAKRPDGADTRVAGSAR